MFKQQIMNKPININHSWDTVVERVKTRIKVGLLSIYVVATFDW